MAVDWTLGWDANDPHLLAGEPPWDRVERAELIQSKVDELLAAGATKVREENYANQAGREILGHVVMLDTERTEFCVARLPARSRTTNWREGR